MPESRNTEHDVQQAERIPLLVITGPTATGKTALGVRLAKRFSGEVVSADSMQIYRDMRIGTARPDEEEMEGVPHHMMGFLPPDQNFSVADYCARASDAIAGIARRGHLPILVGGTGLYITSLVDHIDFEKTLGDPAVRTRLIEEAERDAAALLARLAAVDPETAAKLHPNAKTRIVRALEIYETTGIPKSEWDRRSRSRPSPYRPLIFALTFSDRATLYDRINRRVDLMMERGLLREVERLRAAGIGRDTTAMQAIGYKELCQALDGRCTMEEAVESVKQGSRRYAKRQLTWLRRDPRVRFLYVDGKDTGALEQEIAAVMEREAFL